MTKFRPEPNLLRGLNGDFIGKNNLFRMIREFARYSNIDSGYYMEFGIMNGDTAITAYRNLRGYVNHIYGFDTFSGHPKQKKADQKKTNVSQVSFLQKHFFVQEFSLID